MSLLKILLVEDDELFRTTVKRALLKKPCEVTEAPSGKVAREMLMLHKFDLVISDIQMPHFSGMELLAWIKENQPTPVILMTGFSQALEAKEAEASGVDGFLAKPFQESSLFDAVERFFRKEPESAPPIDLDLDKEFCKIGVDEFLSEKEAAFDIYIRVSKSKFIKIAHSGGKISEERILTYKQKGIYFVFVRKEDFSKIVKFNLRVADVAKKSDKLSVEKKMNFVKSTGALILEHAFVTGVNAEVFRESKDFIENCMNVLTEDDQIFKILGILSGHSDFLYTHSLGVSTFSVMIGRELGWTSTATMFKLAMGGLFHDIGKKEINQEVLGKARALLDQGERMLIESHATRGKEILESLASLPSDVALIASQHHEDAIGQGYPRGLERNDIHPLARVVQVANIFCEYSVKCRPDVEPISGAAALATMQKLKVEAMDKDAFGALKRLFDKGRS